MATGLLKSIAEGERRKGAIWVFSLGLLATMYGLLFLSMTEKFSHFDLMSRCVLMDPKLSRIWSVANVEVGVSYFGVFGAMTYYFVKIRHAQREHMTDLALACAYLLCSFILDWFCVRLFQPFFALLVGDAIVMTFTLLVSRELWFQRLLGVFVPLIFLTCGLGHLLEGLSYWSMTYPVNVPWSMVTADIGFAVLVNSARFPALIRGSDVQEDLDAERVAAAQQHNLFKNVLYAVTDGKLRFHLSADDLPAALPRKDHIDTVNADNLGEARRVVGRIASEYNLSPVRIDMLLTSVGEALMNALVHANGGELTICAVDQEVQVWIRDTGGGIPLNDLPTATLQKGWSSRGTMGIGFPLILSMSDSVDLVTSSRGTTVVITLFDDPDTLIPIALRNSVPTR